MLVKIKPTAANSPGQHMLVMIDARLREANPSKQDQVFGGVSIVLLGDWKQGRKVIFFLECEQK